MSTSFDTKMLALAMKLIDKFGTNATFQVLDADLDPVESELVIGSSVDTVRKIAPPQNFSRRYADNQNIEEGDMQTFVAASGITFTPVVGMKLTHASITWKIVEVRPLYSGDDIAAWELHLRR